MTIRAVSWVHLFAFLFAAVAVTASCGARSQLPAPDAGGEGGSGCPAPGTVVSASIGGGIAHQFLECFDWPGDQVCPSAADAVSHAAPQCFQVLSVDCGPERHGSSCCYVMTEACAET